jgi:ABC-2 type transport system permease protein
MGFTPPILVLRGILLKGNGVSETIMNLWPIGAFLLAAGTVPLVRYRETLD